MSAAPIKKIQFGKVQAAVWENDYNGRKSYSTTFQKSYQDKNKEWKTTTSFQSTDLRDLLVLVTAMLAKQVKERVPQQQQQQPNIQMAQEEFQGEEVPF